LYQWLNKSIAVLELENLDEHLDRFIENKMQQIFISKWLTEKIVRLKGGYGILIK